MLIERLVISLSTSAAILLLIPTIFFTIGKKIESHITQREINRYIQYMCKFAMFSKEDIAYFTHQFKNVLDEETINDIDDTIEYNNKKIKSTVYVVNTCLFMILTCIVLILILYYKIRIYNVASNFIIGTTMFVIVEVFIISYLFLNYCPLDVNAVNRMIIDYVL